MSGEAQRAANRAATPSAAQAAQTAAESAAGSATHAHRRASSRTARQVVVGVRFGVLVLVAALTALVGELNQLIIPLALLTGLAVLVTIPFRSEAIRIAKPLIEAGAAAFVLGASQTYPEPLLPYLVVPPLAAGVEAGFLLAAISTAIVASVLILAQWVISGISGPAQFRSAAEWAGLGLATGAVGAWARIQDTESTATTDTYVAAHMLLSQLREVARALPTGLDEISLGQAMLINLRHEAPFDRAGLYTLNDRGRLVTLTIVGADRFDWEPEPDADHWQRAIDSMHWVEAQGSLVNREDADAAAAILPLRLGDRVIGVVAIERGGTLWGTEALDNAQAIMDGAALQIDTGRLFGEVRVLATMEERRRLAREIHDGIAQEVASLGYVVDAISAESTDENQRMQIQQLREELTRIVSELRLSIFDLRSDVQPDTGLGAALSSYVRQVGATSGLTIHLVLDESAQRLDVAAETELLRIAQEAVTNARKHSRARNLWVTCRVTPPNAFLRVADDGHGLGSPRIDSYGLEIMRERATRLGAKLSVRDRVGGGTVVEVTVGLGD